MSNYACNISSRRLVVAQITKKDRVTITTQIRLPSKRLMSDDSEKREL